MKGELATILTVPDEASVTGFTRLRVFGTIDKPLWSSADLGSVLGIKNVRQNVANLSDDEKGVWNAYTPGGRQDVSVVNEMGLYRLIFASRVPVARKFQRWVCHEVLPSIRKHGSYPPPKSVPAERPPVGCEWADVVRSIADGQREVAFELIRVRRQQEDIERKQGEIERKVDELTGLVHVIGTGVAHLMKNQPQAVAQSPAEIPLPSPQEGAILPTNRHKSAVIRAELTKDPHRTDTHIVEVLARDYNLSVHRTTVTKYRAEMEESREIEPAPRRRSADGTVTLVKYDLAKLPFHTAVDDIHRARTED